jgi:hypothetical protein
MRKNEGDFVDLFGDSIILPLRVKFLSLQGQYNFKSFSGLAIARKLHAFDNCPRSSKVLFSEVASFKTDVILLFIDGCFSFGLQTRGAIHIGNS